ncbi:MAG TPA: hypothetical protein VHD84_02760 [Candidatus Saccharimonadales bacterium]|nr:hypothetical protein [Candidatus Saccharimonadales bacterium]
MTELATEPTAVLDATETRRRPTPVDHANLAVMNLVIKLTEFLQKEHDRDLAVLESRGEKAKRVATVLGAKVVAGLAVTKSGLSQDVVISMINAGKS